jgi:PPOX class probable F420-dependent enzyme
MPRPPIPDEVKAFLAEPNPAVVASLRPDGFPHSVATWYEWRDGQLLLNMDRSRRRLRYLQLDHPVALTVLASDDWYSHASFIGRVSEVRADADLADIDRLSRRYRGEPYWNRERNSVSALVRPIQWFTWGDRFSDQI